MGRARLRAVIIATVVVLAAVGVPTAAMAAPLEADCQIVDDWGTGFQGKCVITNPPPGTVTGWTVRLCFAPATVVITQAWEAAASMSGSPCATFTGLSWNSTIPEGGTVGFGFLGVPGGAAITSCTINGLPC